MLQRVDDVAEGRFAWGRLRRVGQTSWSDWLLVARALEVGRKTSMQVAQTNRPFGKRYTRAMALWLQQNEFEGMTQQERQACHQVLTNLVEIEKWRSSLDPVSRRKINHPDSAFWGWKRAMTVRPRCALTLKRRVITAPTGKLVCWPQDFIRRAAKAMKGAWSPTPDLYVLARAALEAAVRDASDVEELLAPQSAEPKTRNGNPAISSQAMESSP